MGFGLPAGEYFEAHEAFETAWRPPAGERDFFQGLVHAVVFAYQAGRGRRSAPSGSAEGAPPARPYSPAHRGLDVARLLAALQRPSPTFANSWSSAIRSHQSR